MFNLKYRPTDFKDFIGNDSVIKGLLLSYPDWPNTMLITGLPGSGKTTLARIIAKQLQCENINIHEVDAGQDRGIDNIRQIIRGAYNRPLIGKSKVYIFDECQGLTADAQQALLKVTEETPTNTHFIFCSTDPQKIIKALKDRCQRGYINLETLSDKELGTILKNICDKEGIKIEGLIKEIAILCIKNADGIPRNAIMLFNKFYKYDNIENVSKELRISEIIDEELWPLVNALDQEKFTEFLTMFEKKKRGNYESFRITFGNIFKKKLLYSMIRNDIKAVYKYNDILSMFSKPVDNNLGDIELIKRFSKYLCGMNSQKTESNALKK